MITAIYTVLYNCHDDERSQDQATKYIESIIFILQALIQRVEYESSFL